MKKYTKEYLLDKLKMKYTQLGRTPTKEEVEADKDMPHPTTYRDFFGGHSNACIEAGLAPNVVADLSLEKCIKLAQDFYEKYGKVPTISDFNNTPNYPNSCYIRDELGLKWNMFLFLADLPIFTSGEVWIKNRKAELIVKAKLIKQGYSVYDMSEENTNAPHSFLINDEKTMDVRYSSYIVENRYNFWKFKLHLNRKLFTPNYFACVGFNEHDRYEAVFLLPTKDIGVKECVSINSDRIEKSKYFKYLKEREDNWLI